MCYAAFCVGVTPEFLRLFAYGSTKSPSGASSYPYPYNLPGGIRGIGSSPPGPVAGGHTLAMRPEFPSRSSHVAGYSCPVAIAPGRHRRPHNPRAAASLQPLLSCLHPVQGAYHATGTPVQDVGVNHRGAHVAVAQKLLYGADVVAGLQQVGREGVAECVAARVLVHAGLKNGLLDGTLQEGLVHVVAALLSGRGIDPAVLLREQPLPFEFPASRGVLC